MGVGNLSIYAFNRGILGRNALARTDLERTGLSAEVQTNMPPRTLGSMSLRPGLENLTTTLNSNEAILIPFVFKTSDRALIEMSVNNMRISVDGVVITRAINNTNIINGSFTTDIVDWIDDDDVGTTSIYVNDMLGLTGTGFSSARRYQQVSVLPSDMGIRHAVRVTVDRGTCRLIIGTTVNKSDVLEVVTLSQGEHSIAFTPNTTSIFVQLESSTLFQTLIDSIDIEPPGDLILDTPYVDLNSLRWDQSGDVIFIASGEIVRQIERRAVDSWSLVKFPANDGPFLPSNLDSTAITPSGISGDITLSSSADIFRIESVGSLYQITSAGQIVEATLTGESQFTNDILITGSGSVRDIEVSIVGSFSGTITLQQSVGVPGLWTDFDTYTSPTTVTENDAFSDATVFYRIGFKSGDYTSGSPVAMLTNVANSTTGVVEITSFTDERNVDGIVLIPLGGVDATPTWSEGSWSELNGYPSSVVLYEGRLWFAGNDGIWGSVTDSFNSFDPDVEGASGPISRKIGFGPVDAINWMLRLNRLMCGTEGAELSIRSSSFDEPLTPNNFNFKDPSNQGSANVAAVKVDFGGFFVQRSGVRLFQLKYEAESFDYGSHDVSLHVPEIGRPSIIRLCAQRQPDTRIHCVRSDGTVALLIFDRLETVLCWIEIETDGVIEDVAVLPGEDEDEVYYVVSRQVSGGTKRYIERWEKENTTEIFSLFYTGPTTSAISVNHQNGTVLSIRDESGVKIQSNITVTNGTAFLSSSRTNIFLTTAFSPIADNFIRFDFTSETDTLTGLEDFNGKEVVCWADGKDQGRFVVANGQIVLSETIEIATVGLPYAGKYRTTKLAYATESGTALNQVKRVERLGLILRNTHNKGLKYGPTFDELDDMPNYEHADGDIQTGFVYEEYDKEMLQFDGDWDTDSRVCLECQSPLPCTVLGLVVGMETIDDV